MKRTFLFTFLLFGLLYLPSQAQTAEGVINQYLEAIGGNKVLKKIDGMKMIGTFKQGEIEFPLEQVIFADGRQYAKITFVGNDYKQRVYDGENFWSTSFETREAVLEDKEVLNNAKLNFNDFPDALYRYQEKGYSVSILGKPQKFGREVYKLKVRKEDKMVEGVQQPDIAYYYIDVEKGISLAQETIGTEGEMAGKVTTLRFFDYTDVGNGYMMPYRLVQEIDGKKIFELRLNSVEVNPSIPESEFTYPGK